MAAKQTQRAILTAALNLFNAYGSDSVSLQQIADAAGVSKGNLSYHFPNKGSIIIDIFKDLSLEMLQRVRFEEAPARAIMQRMFDQQMDILYKYRFFYRELSRLIDRDPVLHSRFRTFRAQQLSAGQELLNRLVDDGILRPPRTDDEYTTLTKITWCVSTQWPEYAESFLELSEEQAMAEGKTVSLSILNPYFTEKGRSTF